jgi:hypothetical protein
MPIPDKFKDPDGNPYKQPEGPGRPGIMPIPDKFKDPDGNPYKQPGRGPKDLQREAAEDKMRRGGRKGGRKGGRW